jgi:phosphatidylglycerol:prolipoprotein diacylglycerol transferase
MKINGSGPYHPTFLYEFLLDLAVFGVLIWYRKRKKADGEVFFLYMILYGIGRMFIEGLRTDSLYIGNLRVSQVLAFLFAVSFTVIFFIHRKKVLTAQEEAQPGTSEYSSILNKMREEEQDHTESADKNAGTVEEEQPGNVNNGDENTGIENNGDENTGKDVSEIKPMDNKEPGLDKPADNAADANGKNTDKNKPDGTDENQG